MSFTERARAAGRARADEWMRGNGGPQTTGHYLIHTSIAAGFREGTDWAVREPWTDEEIDAAVLAFLTAENIAVIPGISRERAAEYASEEMEQGSERVREALRAALSAAMRTRRGEQ